MSDPGGRFLMTSSSFGIWPMSGSTEKTTTGIKLLPIIPFETTRPVRVWKTKSIFHSNFSTEGDSSSTYSAHSMGRF